MRFVKRLSGIENCSPCLRKSNGSEQPWENMRSKSARDANSLRAKEESSEPVEENRNGPRMLRLSCASFLLSTDTTWSTTVILAAS